MATITEAGIDNPNATYPAICIFLPHGVSSLGGFFFVAPTIPLAARSRSCAFHALREIMRGELATAAFPDRLRRELQLAVVMSLLRARLNMITLMHFQ